MIKVSIKEYREGDHAVRATVATFLGITVFKYNKVTTNNNAVKLLTVASQSKKIKGFYETED